MNTSERLAIVETRVNNIDVRTERIESQVSDIHNTVVENKADSKWRNKLIIFLVTAILGGGITFGFKSIGDSSTAVAAPNEKVEATDR
jgi:hypothetical protein